MSKIESVLVFASLFLSFGCASQVPLVSRHSDLNESSVEDTEFVTTAVGVLEHLELSQLPKIEATTSNKNVLELQGGSVNGRFLLLPLKKGSATVELHEPSGKVFKVIRYNVVSNELMSQINAIRKLLGKIEGVSIEASNDTVVIDGKLSRPETAVRDYDRILKVQEMFKGIAVNYVTLSDALYEESARQMQVEISKIPGASSVNVRILNGTFVLEGEAPSLDVRETAETFVQLMLPPLQGSGAIRENILVLGAKKYSIRNMIRVFDDKSHRSPASTCHVK